MGAHAYEDAYKMVRDVRVGVNEFSATLWAGTDTSGKFDNTYILDQLNAAQARIYALMMKTEARDVFQTSASITGSSSVYTLPNDFGRVIQFEDVQGHKVFPSSSKDLPLVGDTGSENLYYRKGSTLVLNKSGVSDVYTLKYFKMPRRMTAGLAAASSATNSLIMAAAGTVYRNDYYNGFIIDNYTDGTYGTITDFVASTRVATTDNSVAWNENDGYGIVSDLPQETHFLIAPLAVIFVKAQNPAAQERPTKLEVDLWAEMMMETIVAFTNQPDDIPIEDIFCDFGQSVPWTGVNIPGQGYTIFG
jgi:hypothetical protein